MLQSLWSRGIPRIKNKKTTEGGTRIYHSWHNSYLRQKHIQSEIGSQPTMRVPGPYWCIRLTTRAWKSRLYLLPPTKDYVPRIDYITGRTYHYACCTAVVVSLGILSFIEWLDTFYKGVPLSLLTLLVSSWDLVIRTGRSMADGMSLPRVITNELLQCGQPHSEPTKGSPRRWYHQARGRASRFNSIELGKFCLLPITRPICFSEAGKHSFACWCGTPAYR